MSEVQYSFKKGIVKALISALTVGGAFIAFAGLADFTLWELLEQYLKPVIGSLTVGGLITLSVNFLKVRGFGSRHV